MPPAAAPTSAVRSPRAWLPLPGCVTPPGSPRGPCSVNSPRQFGPASKLAEVEPSFTDVMQAPRSVGEGRFDGWSYRVAQDPDGDDTYQMVVQHAQTTE